MRGRCTAPTPHGWQVSDALEKPGMSQSVLPVDLSRDEQEGEEMLETARRMLQR